MHRLIRLAAFVPTLLLAETEAIKSSTPAEREWREYLGGPDRNHFSPLTQITTENVAALEVAWTYHTGEFGEMQTNPIVSEGVLYGTTPSGAIFALDAATGQERWKYSQEPAGARNLRGVVYWEDGDDCRIFFTRDDWLHALDARTGLPVTQFGENGRTSLRAGLGESARDKYVISTTPGTVFGHLIIMPLRVDENEDAAPGSIQAFDLRTGRLEWVFHTIPHPGEFGYETWPKEAYTNFNIGAANCWAGMAIDRVRGIVYVPTGSPGPDFWGGNRRGQNLFANCLLALDAATGKRLWHFQFVHHDIWDRDPPAPPNLVTIRREGRAIDAVAQVTKQGFIFLFDRVTGEPLFPIDEQPMPASDLAREESWPTQPIPRHPEPFSRQTLTDDDINPYSPDRDLLLAAWRSGRFGRFLPFNQGTTFLFPGFDGGAEWGGAAADPEGVLYINDNAMAWMARLVETAQGPEFAHFSPGQRLYATYCVGCHGKERAGNPASGIPSLQDLTSRKSRDEISAQIEHGRGMMPGFPWIALPERQALADFLLGTERPAERSSMPAAGEQTPPESSTVPVTDKQTPYRLDGYVKFLDREGYPGIRPPWGTLNAVDLATGEYRWKVVLGEYKELTAKGIPPTGAENYGGPIVTAGNLLFIAATKDGLFRAFDKRSGKQLWEAKLPAPAFATPSTYEVDGKQYVVVACGGAKLQTSPGDSYIAFRLP